MINLAKTYSRKALTGLLLLTSTCLNCAEDNSEAEILSSSHHASSSPTQQLYIAFSGEAKSPDTPVKVIKAFDVTKSNGVFTVTGTHDVFTQEGQELRNTALNNGNLFVTQAYKRASGILEFGPIKSDGSRDPLGMVVTPDTTPGLNHPYDVVIGDDGLMYVSSQDSNIVSYFSQNHHGAWQPAEIPHELKHYKLAPGTFVGAHSSGVSGDHYDPIPKDKGGLTFTDGTHSHSVRGIAWYKKTLYVANQADNSVFMYDTDDGKFLGQIADHDSVLNKPVQIQCHKDLVYIGCPGNATIQVYDPSKKKLSQFIHDAARLDSASGISFGLDGNLYVADRKGKAIHRYSDEGSFIDTFINLSAYGITDSPEGIMWVQG